MEKTGTTHRSARDLAYCGLFGAAPLLFPAAFHLVRLGNAFMPMCLPIIALAFFVPPLPAAITALTVPILSGAASPLARRASGVSGMPRATLHAWMVNDGSDNCAGMPGWQ